MSSAQVSIIVPLYNRQDLIQATIDSVIKQSFGDWELIIVDDGSTDDSFEIAHRAAQADKRIGISRRNREPKGAPTCRNQGLERAKGAYTIFLDSDDLLALGCLESRLAKYAKYSDHDFLAFGALFFDEHPGDSTDSWGVPADDYLSDFLDGPIWQTACPIWKTSWIKSIGGWKEGLPSWQDWELHVRALTFKPRFEYFPDEQDTFIRRTPENRMSLVASGSQLHLRERQHMFADIMMLLQERRLLTPNRETSFVRLFMETAVLQRLADSPNEADQTLAQIPGVSNLKLSIMKWFVAFESNHTLRLPVLRSTVRRVIKTCFWFCLGDCVRRRRMRLRLLRK